MFDDKLPTMTERYPYAVSVGPVALDTTNFCALADMNLLHVTDYIYWKDNVRFKDAENATMYKLMQNI
jgi:hypothetical protein